MNRNKIMEHLQERDVSQEAFDYIVNLEKNVYRLNNIINRLKEYANETAGKSFYDNSLMIRVEDFLDILRELEEGRR